MQHSSYHKPIGRSRRLNSFVLSGRSRSALRQPILDLYGIHLKQAGQELRGKGPIHGGDNKGKHFRVSLSKNAFRCFYDGWHAHGNVLDLVAAMERCSVREAGVKLRDWFAIGERRLPASQPKDADHRVHVQRGIYRHNGEGEQDLYEVTVPVALTDDLESVVVYRELFGNYRYPVAAPENFDQASDDTFVLLKTL